MKMAAIDYGEKRIGIAVSDDLGMLARPLTTLLHSSLEESCRAIADIFHIHSIEKVLIGLPRNMDGSEGASAQAVRIFMDELKKHLSIPVQLVDERLSTVQASRLLHESGKNTRRQKSIVDAASATLLLQSFLDINTL